ncbi:MAG: lamin tail domain-containing protein, partial [Patescibacteria group bacterium]
VPDEEEIPQNISSGAVRINELLPNPFGDEEELEFIELYNTTLDPIDLSLWFLRDSSQGKGYLIPSGTNIPGKGYFVLFRSNFGFALNNSNESVSLFDTQDIEHDKVSYEKTKEGISLNALSGKLRGGTPTPGAENILNTLPETRGKIPKKGFRDVPVSFDAKGDDTDKDKLKYVWNFGDNHKSYKEKTSHTYDTNGTYTVTLTVNDGKDETAETFSLKITDYEAPKLRITALFPNPHGKDSESEWIRILNKEKKEVNLKGFSIATGSSSKKMTNHPIQEDFIIPGGKERILSRTTSLFTLPNKKGRIELRGPDKKTIDKVKYSEAKSIPEDALYEKNKQKEWEWKKSIPIETSPSEVKSEETEQPSPNEEVLGAVAPPREEPLSPETLEREILQKEKELRYDNLRILLTSQTEFIALEKTILPEDTFSKEKILDEELSFIEKINLLLNTWLLQ